MKPVRSRPRRVAPFLILLAAAIFGWFRTSTSAASATVAKFWARLDLSAVGTPAHREQIRRVVESMDRTRVPPAGVVQGGRNGGRQGVFQNAEGRLPRRPRGYWIESDVWPKKGPRDAERLIFGRDHEVYWTRDHYETFVRLR